MADQKISQLTELTAVAGADLVPIVDVSANETKYIKYSNINNYTLTLLHGGFSPADSTTYYFGGAYGSSPTSSGSTYYRLYIPKAGVINHIDTTMINSGTFASTEDSTLAIRLNDTTDYTLTSVLKYNANGGYYPLPSQSIAVAAGDYIVAKWITPAWVTNPTGVIHNITLFITS